MNRRQKKKQFKKRFGFNPPREFSIHNATKIMENREKILAMFGSMKRAILDLWEQAKKPAFELVEELKKIETAFISVQERNRQQREALVDFQIKVILQQRQQERKENRVESNINILDNDRR